MTVNDALVFDDTSIPIPDPAYFYTIGTTITPLTLPPATGGGGMLSYTLMPVPAGLSFNAGARTLTGIPTTGSNAVTLTYTATDADGMTTSLTFMVTVYAATLSIADVEVDEGVGTATATVTVRLDNVVTGGFRVDALLLGVSATAGTDYTADISRTLTFDGDAGETQTFSVTIVDDGLDEDDETVRLSLDNLQGNSVPVDISDTATLTITDDDSGLTVESVRYFADEAASIPITQVAIGTHVYIVVTFSENVRNVNTVDDFNIPTSERMTGQPEILVRSLGVVPPAIVNLRLPIRAHNTAFQNEASACRATSDGDTSSAYLCQVFLDPLVGTGAPLQVVLGAGAASTSGGNTLVVEQEADAGIDVVDTPAAPTVMSITHYADADIETAPEISGTVIDGSIYSVIQFTGLHIASPQISYQIGTASDAVQVPFGSHTTGGTPENGTCALIAGDYSMVPANQSFWCRYNTRTGDTGTGDTSTTYKVIVGTDTTDTAGLTLDGDYTDDTGVMLKVTTGTATLSIADVEVDEGAGTATVSVTVDDMVTGGFSVVPMTADDTATDGLDYTAVSGQTLSFAGTFAGETLSFTVAILDDALYEGGASGVAETVVVSLGDPVGTAVSVDSSATATISITDNEYQVALTMEDFSVSEGAGTAIVSVSLDTVVPGAFNVVASTVDGTATAPGDYTAVSGQTLNFAGTFGETQTFSVPITNDTTPEFPETLTVLLRNLDVPTDTATTVGTLRPASATITIMDDDISTGGVNLNLLFPVTVDGKTYFYLDQNGNGRPDNDAEDGVTHTALDRLLNGGSDTEATRDGVHNGQDDARSVIVGDTVVILPTLAELMALRSSQSNATPPSWAMGPGEGYWTSNRVRGNVHVEYILSDGTTRDSSDDSMNYVAFQVRTLPTFSAGIDSPQTYTVGQPVALTLPEADGGVGTLSYTLTRDDSSPVALPAGLAFNPAARTISGTPSEPFGGIDGDSLRYTVTDATVAVRHIVFRLRVAAAPALVAIDDQTYAADIAVNQPLPAATGGVAPLTYTLTPTALIPKGLTFDAATQSIKSIEGMSIMETATVVTLTYTVTDANSITAEQTFTVTVNAALVFDNTIIPIPDQAYTYIVGTTITPLTLAPATGGGTPLTYTLTPLPAGLTFNADADPRTLTGTPTARGDAATLTLTYTVTDANGITTEQTFTVTVNDALVFDDTSIPIPDPAYFYTAGTTITPLTLPPATGGGGMLSYTLMPVPDGLSFDADADTRTLTGTPATGSNAVTLTYTATDADGMTTSLTFMVTVYAATLSIADVVVGEGVGTATVTVRLDNAVPGRFSVDALLQDVSATADADYTADVSRTLTFDGDAGETQTFSVTIVDDALDESDETVTLSLDKLQGNSIPVDISDTATLTITDDDSGLTVRSVGYFADEAARPSPSPRRPSGRPFISSFSSARMCNR